MATTKSNGETFSADEKKAMKERAKELKSKESGASAVQKKIAAMPDFDRELAERIHELVMAAAPELTPKTWYGMPAYAKDGKIICYFTPASKFKSRYATFGFDNAANIDEGSMWPASFGLTELTAADAETLTALVKKAVS